MVTIKNYHNRDIEIHVFVNTEGIWEFSHKATIAPEQEYDTCVTEFCYFKVVSK